MVLLLRRAKRVRVSFEGEDVTKASSLILDTELIRYKWVSYAGSYPEWQKLIPTEHKCLASFDTVEAIKAVRTLKALADSKAYPIDLTIGDGKVVMANTDDKGQAEIHADTDGEGFVRIDGGYLVEVLKACGGMVELKLINSYSPTLFTANGYQLVVMPMISDKANEQMKRDSEAKAQAEAQPTEQVAEVVADKPKRKHKAKEPVAA